MKKVHASSTLAHASVQLCASTIRTAAGYAHTRSFFGTNAAQIQISCANWLINRRQICAGSRVRDMLRVASPPSRAGDPDQIGNEATGRTVAARHYVNLSRPVRDRNRRCLIGPFRGVNEEQHGADKFDTPESALAHTCSRKLIRHRRPLRVHHSHDVTVSPAMKCGQHNIQIGAWYCGKNGVGHGRIPGLAIDWVSSRRRENTLCVRTVLGREMEDISGQSEVDD